LYFVHEHKSQKGGQDVFIIAPACPQKTGRDSPSFRDIHSHLVKSKEVCQKDDFFFKGRCTSMKPHHLSCC
jgi:hypothetical protein